MTGRLNLFAQILVASAMIPLAGLTEPAPAPGSKSPSTPSATPPAAAPAPKVTVIEPGSEPRRELRLAAPAGQESTAVITIQSSQIMATAGGPSESKLPPVQFTVPMKVASVDPGGDMHVEFQYADAKALEEPGVNPHVMMTMSANAAAVKGTRGTMIVSPRGQTRESKLLLPPDLNPIQRQQIQGVAQSMDQIMTVLPQEPVGVGGRWTVESDIDLSGIKMKQVITITVQAIEADKVTLATRMTQEARPQDFLMSGFSAHLDSYQGTIVGTYQLKLSEIAPLSVDATAATKMTYSFPTLASAAPKSQEVKVKTMIRRPEVK